MTNSPGTTPEKPLEHFSKSDMCLSRGAVDPDWTSSLRAPPTTVTSGMTSSGKRLRSDDNHATRDFHTLDKSELIAMIKSLQEQNLLLTRCLADKSAATSSVPQKETFTFNASSTGKSKWASSDSSAAFPALSGKPTPGNTTSSSGSKPKKGGKTYSTVTQTASATTTQPVATKKPITAKAKKWAARLFASPVDPTTTTADKSGYSFVYLPSNKRTTYSELRERIKLIGVNLTRIYSISRPAKHVVAILVHSAYAKELLDLFTKAGIKPILDFSPTSARTIGDPRLLETLKSDQQREDKAKSIYYNSLLRATIQLRDAKLGLHILNCFNKLDQTDRHYVPEILVQQFLKLKPEAIRPPRNHANSISKILGGFDATTLFDSLEGTQSPASATAGPASQLPDSDSIMDEDDTTMSSAEMNNDL
ncbi:unnamed protein product [Mucor hiemalis]